MRGRWRRAAEDEAGATALEFALIAMPLLMFTFGILEFARALFLQQAMAHATDHAARMLYVAPATTNAALTAAIKDELQIGDPTKLTVAITPTTQDGMDAIEFDLTYDFHFVVPSIKPGGIDLHHSRVVIVGD